MSVEVIKFERFVRSHEIKPTFFLLFTLVLCLFVYISCRRDKKKKATTSTTRTHTHKTQQNDVDNAISVINATEIIQHREKCVTQRPISGL